jgi:hypothetical protein
MINWKVRKGLQIGNNLEAIKERGRKIKNH